MTLCSGRHVWTRWLIFHFSGGSCSTQHPCRHDLTHTSKHTLHCENSQTSLTDAKKKRKAELLGKERKMSRFRESYYFSAEREIASDCDLWDNVPTLLLWDVISPGTFMTGVLSLVYYISCYLVMAPEQTGASGVVVFLSPYFTYLYIFGGEGLWVQAPSLSLQLMPFSTAAKSIVQMIY